MAAASANPAIVSSREISHSRPVGQQTSFIFLTACFAVLLFALVPATTRIAAAQLSGLSIGLIRTVGAGIFGIPLLLVLRLSPPRSRKDWCLLLLYAFGNFAGFPILFGLGVQRTSGSHAALIMAAMPLFVGLLGITLERRLPRWSWFAGMALAIAGEAALVTMGNASATGASISGDAIVFAACTLSAIGVVAGARLGTHMSPRAATLWAIVIAGMALAPWAALRLLASPLAYQQLTVTTWAAVLQITLGAAVIANVAWLWAVSRGGLTRVAPIQFAQPVCALFLASALLNEHLSPTLLLVAASIIVGTVTACRGARSNSAAKKRDSAADLPFVKDAPSLVPPDPARMRALLKFMQQPAYAGAAKAPATEPARVATSIAAPAFDSAGPSTVTGRRCSKAFGQARPASQRRLAVGIAGAV
jgi:drug/metabolite transporter (DMT)-like permease